MQPITRRTLLATSAAFAATPAFAQAPTSMTIVVPFPPGGSTDALARLLQPGLQAALNRNVIVENKAGAAGGLGAAQVAKSTPDGSSILVTFDSHAVRFAGIGQVDATSPAPSNVWVEEVRSFVDHVCAATGAAEGSIIATIITAHMTKAKPASTAVQRSSSGMPISAMSAPP